MASYGIRVLRGGTPVAGAQVTAGTHLDGVSNNLGVVNGDIDKGGRAIVVPIVVTGSGFEMGSAGIRIAPGTVTDVEV